jgi:hypothetical protein
MKKARLLKMAMIAGLCIVLASCANAPVSFKSVADQKYDATRGRAVSGSACGFQLLLLIPIMTNNRAELAYMSLMHQAGTDYVTDVKVRESWYYAFIGTVYCTELQAMAYPKITTSTAASTQQ